MNEKRKLKICFVGDMSNVHCQRPVNFLVDRGHEVHVVDDNHYKYKNLKLHYLKNYTGIRIIDYIIRLLRARCIIRKIKPDLVHCEQITYHGFIGALSGIHPFMITPWGSDMLFDPEKSFMHRGIIKFVLDNADVIHHIDVSGIDRLDDVYGDTRNKAFILNEGTNTKVFRKRKSDKRKNKVSILSLRPLKDAYNPILFVEALNIVINEYEHRNAEGIMCGSLDYGGQYSYKKKIDKLIDKYNLSQYMKFYKWVKEPTYAQKLMENADIYIDTMDRVIKGQGTGKTALEAMSSELAMVMPDNPSIELYIKHMKNGIIYKKNNPESLASALIKLIKNKKLRIKLGRNARKFIVANLDWNKNMKIMEDKYYELVNKWKRKL